MSFSFATKLPGSDAAQIRCIVVILTFNSASIIRETLTQALKVSKRIFLLDSFSTDDTCSVARSFGCEVFQRKFINYAEQRNWAISHVERVCEWQLHLDADEVLDGRVTEAICRILDGGATTNSFAYLLKRRDYFMGQELRFSGLSPWHLRLFPSGSAKCEDRLYDQHFISDLPVRRLPGIMHDKNSQTISEWVTRHNRWSDLEAQQIGLDAEPNMLQPALFGDPRKRTRLLKKMYYVLPIAVRGVIYFFYRYFVRLGFLDGMVGFYFALFQGLWFRSLVDAKLVEFRRARANEKRTYNSSLPNGEQK